MPIALKPVTSSFIGAVGYDLASRTLAVGFLNGTVAHFSDVPPEVAEAFDKAESPGRYFTASIRGQFTSKTVSPEAEHEGATPD